MPNIFRKKNIFKFVPIENGIEDIKPAKSYIPDWYKSIKPFNKSNISFDNSNKQIKNLKLCIPFLDALTSGYIVELGCDVYFDTRGDNKTIKWGGSALTPLQVRSIADHSFMPTPPGYDDINHYAWIINYAIETPPGYSILVTHPFNRFDLPFISFTGIVDAEQLMQAGNCPFVLKKDFVGIIEKGTPILQIIPFKRENWTSEKDESLLKKDAEERSKSNNVFFGYYKNNKWIKKNYE